MIKSKSNYALYCAILFFLLFVFWTLTVCFIDVKAIGPQDSVVGLSTLNGLVHNLFGVNMLLYEITDWLGLVPIACCLGFAIMGLVQWIIRKNVLKVDFNILVLGGYYIVVIIAYLFFEHNVINYRPILINGYLEASYPSSTTMLVLCVMPTTLMQFDLRIKNKSLSLIVKIAIIAFILFMVLGRLVSGVHWLSDIVGGLLLSAGLVSIYHFIIKKFEIGLDI